MAITVFSTTAAESALAISIFAADELFYSIEVSLISRSQYSLTLLFFFDKPNIGVGIFTLIGTQVDLNVQFCHY